MLHSLPLHTTNHKCVICLTFHQFFPLLSFLSSFRFLTDGSFFVLRFATLSVSFFFRVLSIYGPTISNHRDKYRHSALILVFYHIIVSSVRFQIKTTTKSGTKCITLSRNSFDIWLLKWSNLCFVSKSIHFPRFLTRCFREAIS